MHGAIERSRETRVFRKFIRRTDDLMDTKTFPQIEEVLNAIDPERAILYRKCMRPDFQFCVLKAGLAIKNNFDVIYLEMVRLKRIAGQKHDTLIKNLIRDRCLPKWFTYDKAVFSHEGILWCQPGKMGTRSKRLITKIHSNNSSPDNHPKRPQLRYQKPQDGHRRGGRSRQL